jgi:hypothetical protein
VGTVITRPRIITHNFVEAMRTTMKYVIEE